MTRVLFFLCLLVLPSADAVAIDEPIYSLHSIRAALAGVQVSQGPEASELTRSPWGPNLYRSTVDAVPLIYLPGETADTGVSGSGVVVTSAGHILTNWHVVRDKPYAAVVFRPKPPRTMETLTDADVWVAKHLGSDSKKDIALLQLVGPLKGPKPVDLSFLKFIPLEDPMLVEVGQDVFAIGHPQGLYWSYTEGVISQIRPRYKWTAGDDLFQATIVQTQTAISYGSSGGPLINRDGKLVGLVSSMITGQAGFNFAIAVHELKPLFGQ
jgi:S1-C subfamily serine protease